MIETASLNDQIEKVLRRDILSGERPPGKRLSIEEIAAELGVSTTPVRDAVRRLASCGLVRIEPRRGVYVSAYDVGEFRRVFELRIALECLAVQHAAARAPITEVEHAIATYQAAGEQLRATGDYSLLEQNDRLVHDLILRHCDNDKLIEIMRQLSDLIAWARNVVVSRTHDSYSRALPEHIEILEAIARRDAAGAEAALRRHLTRSYEDAVAESQVASASASKVAKGAAEVGR